MVLIMIIFSIHFWFASSIFYICFNDELKTKSSTTNIGGEHSKSQATMLHYVTDDYKEVEPINVNISCPVSNESVDIAEPKI